MVHYYMTFSKFIMESVLQKLEFIEMKRYLVKASSCLKPPKCSIFAYGLVCCESLYCFAIFKFYLVLYAYEYLFTTTTTRMIDWRFNLNSGRAAFYVWSCLHSYIIGYYNNHSCCSCLSSFSWHFYFALKVFAIGLLRGNL